MFGEDLEGDFSIQAGVFGQVDLSHSFGKVNIKELAQQCGRSRSFMGRVLSGEKGPSVDTLHRMSRYFNLSMDETYEILKRIRQAPSVWLG